MFDVVVVGAGSAGCILAARLSEDAHCRVLLVETGPDYPDLATLPSDLKYCFSTGILSPNALQGGKLASRPIAEIHDWQYTGAATALHPEVPLPRGRATGGSSAINGAVWLRGPADDYDAWAAAGNAGWSYADLLPIFRRMENDPGGSEELHGRSGPVPIRRFSPDEWLRPHAAFREAAIECGHVGRPGVNGSPEVGVSSVPFNNPNDIRQSSALTYLNPARTRPNLMIASGSSVTKVIMDGARAVGVEMRNASGESSQVAGRKVVLCAGAIASPQLLMLSGIGPADELTRHGIEVRRSAEGVGRNLQDHPVAPLTWQLRAGFQVGPKDPRYQMVVLARSPEARGAVHDVWIVNAVVHDVLSMYAGVDLAESTGRIRLTSSDPSAYPLIDLNYFSNEVDLARMRFVVEASLDIASAAPLGEVLNAAISPDLAIRQNRDALDEWILTNTISANHLSGTCKMGPTTDPDAVVDSRGRVHGVDGLYVADASIMPFIPRAATNATSMAIGERISDFMREDLHAG